MKKLFDKTIKVCIYLLVFLLPLFWLPFSFEQFEFNKQYLLFFLVSLSFFAWIAKMVLIDKEIRFKKTPLDIFVAVFIFIAILSAIFSVDKSSSIFGFYGRFSDGLIGLLSLGALYFLITNNAGKSDGYPIPITGVLRMFFLSAFFVILLTLLSLFGIWTKISNQLAIFQNLNPVSNSVQGLAMFLSVVLVLLVGMILLREKGKKTSLIINYLLVAAVLFLLLMINFKAAWIVILVSLAFFIGFTLKQRTFREVAAKLILPIILMILAGVFIIINFQLPISNFQLTREPVLGQGVSWQVGLGAATDNIKSGFLGSGVGTYFYDFSKFKPKEFNASPLWQIRFDRPGNHISEMLATMGFLGLVSYLALIGMFLLISWFILGVSGSKSQIPLLMGFLALVVGQFVYYQNTTLAFMFWLILGLSVVGWEKPLKEINFSLKRFPELSLIATALLIVVGLGILGSYYFGFQFYRADVIYAKAQKMVLSQERTALIEKAVKLNPALIQYQIILSRTYLNDVLTEMRKPQDQQDSAKIQSAVAKAIDTARVATQRGPGEVAAIETLAMIYRDIRLVASGALEWGIKSFEKAISLEPANPVFYTELGKLYLASENLQKAKEKIEDAKDLKPDYIDALIQEALIFEKEDNSEEAIKRLENLSLIYPFNAEILFQLGRLYFNTNRVDEAILQLEKVVETFPNHSNALYSLGVAYQKKGQIKKAVSTFEKVLELNPGNQDIIKKLEELKKK